MDGRGRPRQVVRKEELIHMRVTAVEKQALLSKARAANQSLSEFVLSRCLAAEGASSEVCCQLSLLGELDQALELTAVTVHFPDTVAKQAMPKRW